MQRDSLESDKIVPAWDAAGDRRGPSVVVVDHLSRTPVAVPDCAGYKTRLIDLELQLQVGEWE